MFLTLDRQKEEELEADNMYYVCTGCLRLIAQRFFAYEKIEY